MVELANVTFRLAGPGFAPQLRQDDGRMANDDGLSDLLEHGHLHDAVDGEANRLCVHVRAERLARRILSNRCRIVMCP